MHATSRYQEELGFASDHRYRRTPEGQPIVADLVRRGMEIRSSYNTGGLVLSVDGPFVYLAKDVRFEHYSIVYVDAAHWTDKTPEHHAGWINEMVAVNGRLLKLFEANDDEVFIVGREARPSENSTGQLSFF